MFLEKNFISFFKFLKQFPKCKHIFYISFSKFYKNFNVKKNLDDITPKSIL